MMENEVRLVDANALAFLSYHVTDNIIGVERCVVEWEDIENAPTIDPESLRPKGRWVDKMVRDWHCSECGKSVPKQVCFDGYCYNDKLNYCPNCGAKMRGETNDE